MTEALDGDAGLFSAGFVAQPLRVSRAAAQRAAVRRAKEVFKVHPKNMEAQTARFEGDMLLSPKTLDAEQYAGQPVVGDGMVRDCPQKKGMEVYGVSALCGLLSDGARNDAGSC
ncbi:hypothetical protein [Glutamicibacter arilaitensis]|uniref:hypothetical protein n=2 Tax=Glutamicibacter TaxID=1742989 RepID=UPI003FD6BCA3